MPYQGRDGLRKKKWTLTPNRLPLVATAAAIRDWRNTSFAEYAAGGCRPSPRLRTGSTRPKLFVSLCRPDANWDGGVEQDARLPAHPLPRRIRQACHPFVGARVGVGGGVVGTAETDEAVLAPGGAPAAVSGRGREVSVWCVPCSYAAFSPAFSHPGTNPRLHIHASALLHTPSEPPPPRALLGPGAQRVHSRVAYDPVPLLAQADEPALVRATPRAHRRAAGLDVVGVRVWLGGLRKTAGLVADGFMAPLGETAAGFGVSDCLDHVVELALVWAAPAREDAATVGTPAERGHVDRNLVERAAEGETVG